MADEKPADTERPSPAPSVLFSEFSVDSGEEAEAPTGETAAIMPAEDLPGAPVVIPANGLAQFATSDPPRRPRDRNSELTRSVPSFMVNIDFDFEPDEDEAVADYPPRASPVGPSVGQAVGLSAGDRPTGGPSDLPGVAKTVVFSPAEDEGQAMLAEGLSAEEALAGTVVRQQSSPTPPADREGAEPPGITESLTENTPLVSGAKTEILSLEEMGVATVVKPAPSLGPDDGVSELFEGDPVATVDLSLDGTSPEGTSLPDGTGTPAAPALPPDVDFLTGDVLPELPPEPEPAFAGRELEADGGLRDILAGLDPAPGESGNETEDDLLTWDKQCDWLPDLPAEPVSADKDIGCQLDKDEMDDLFRQGTADGLQETPASLGGGSSGQAAIISPPKAEFPDGALPPEAEAAAALPEAPPTDMDWREPGVLPPGSGKAAGGAEKAPGSPLAEGELDDILDSTLGEGRPPDAEDFQTSDELPPEAVAPEGSVGIELSAGGELTDMLPAIANDTGSLLQAAPPDTEDFTAAGELPPEKEARTVPAAGQADLEKDRGLEDLLGEGQGAAEEEGAGNRRQGLPPGEEAPLAADQVAREALPEEGTGEQHRRGEGMDTVAMLEAGLASEGTSEDINALFVEGLAAAPASLDVVADEGGGGMAEEMAPPAEFAAEDVASSVSAPFDDGISHSALDDLLKEQAVASAPVRVKDASRRKRLPLRKIVRVGVKIIMLASQGVGQALDWRQNWGLYLWVLAAIIGTVSSAIIVWGAQYREWLPLF